MKVSYLVHRVLPTAMFAVFLGIIMPLDFANAAGLSPQTKIRLTIVQWMQSRGQYERWEALGGEYTVSDDGAVSVPFIGALSVGDLDTVSLANEIARRLQERIGLVQAPAVTIEIIEYPPVYVVGDVTTPGEYKFRPGLTVLQALAMGGGPLRATNGQQTQTIKLAGELRESDHLLLRSAARLARLQAEMAGAKEIAFDQPTNGDQQYASGTYDEERAIFQTRASALDRQSKALTELRSLLVAEIDTLEEKLKGSDDNIRSVEDQLTSVKSLVERGLTVSSRQLDLERLLTTYRSDRLDLVTAVMRGRQAISETTRNLEGLYDNRRSELAAELQSEQTKLDQLKLSREVTQKLLIDELSTSDGSGSRGEALPLTFTVSRRDDDQINQFPALETTVLVPGDVVGVVQTRISDGVPQPTSVLSSAARVHADQTSQ